MHESASWHMGHVSELVCPYRLAHFWLWIVPVLSLSVVVWILGVTVLGWIMKPLERVPYGSDFLPKSVICGVDVG